jgi:hypothetical protein
MEMLILETLDPEDVSSTCAQKSHELVILGFIKISSEHKNTHRLSKKKLEEVPIKAGRV